MNRSTVFSYCVALGFVTMTASCGGSGARTTPVVPTGPTVSPPPAPAPAAPPPPNEAPVIRGLLADTTRVEADQRVELTADVEDADTPVDQLTYEWTSDKGTGVFIGSGWQVKWQAPHLKPTPDTYVLTVTVIERYDSEGETKENRTSASVAIHYNDSDRELRDLVLTFLGDFSTFSTSAEACVRNFHDSCPGKAEEQSQIQDNRRLYKIQSGTYSIGSISFNADLTLATAIAPCTFISTVNATGKTETATGQCILTGIYDTDKSKWFLCDSFFHGSSTFSPKALETFAP